MLVGKNTSQSLCPGRPHPSNKRDELGRRIARDVSNLEGPSKHGRRWPSVSSRGWHSWPWAVGLGFIVKTLNRHLGGQTGLGKSE